MLVKRIVYSNDFLLRAENDILKKVGNQTTLDPIDFYRVDMKPHFSFVFHRKSGFKLQAKKQLNNLFLAELTS